jgi:hypothetical protein
MVNRFLLGLAAGLLLSPAQLLAEQRWLDPISKDCSLAPGEQCVIDVECPAVIPSAVSGIGAMPKVSREDHEVVMTMNGRIAPNAWRARWENQAVIGSVDVEVSIRVLCTDDWISWDEEPASR